MKIRNIAISGAAAVLALATGLVVPATAHASDGGCYDNGSFGTCIEINGAGLYVNWMRASTDNKLGYTVDIQTCIRAEPQGAPQFTVACTPFENVQSGHSTSYAYGPSNQNYPGGWYCARTWYSAMGVHQLANEECQLIHA